MYDNTDSIANKAWISDGRDCFQCYDCGRLYVQDEGSLRYYTAYISEVPAPDLLSSSLGEKWPARLYAEWHEVKPDYATHHGVVWSDDLEGIVQYYDDYALLERDYYARFNKMLGRGALQCASLKIGFKWIHQWPPRK